MFGAFALRHVEACRRANLITNVLSTCPGAFESLLEERTGSSEMPVIPEGNPIMPADVLEDVVTYYFLKFDDAGVLHRTGGGKNATWDVNEKRWYVSHSDF